MCGGGGEGGGSGYISCGFQGGEGHCIYLLLGGGSSKIWIMDQNFSP